jgi:hypothetical protein
MASTFRTGDPTGSGLANRPVVGCEPGRLPDREISVVDSDLQVVDGVLITTPLRTVFDWGRWLSLVEGTVVADALSHAKLGHRG